MHDGHAHHTVRSHRMAELERIKEDGTRVGAYVSGRIVHVAMGSDGAPRSIVIADGLGNYYSLPGFMILEPVPEDGGIVDHA